MAKDVIIACDFSSEAETLEFLEKLGSRKPFVKIGMELFYSAGPQMVKKIAERGNKIFLDLKLHDIPNTVRKAMANLAGLGVFLCNVHAAGGIKMMQAAREGLQEGAARTGGTMPLLIAVTQLTSTDDEMLNKELLIQASMNDTILKYAENAHVAGLDGVVCSPLESRMLQKHFTEKGASFLTVTPGIRFRGADTDDQKRITTPRQARRLGSDYIVVGRPITAAADPKAAYDRCVNDFLTDNPEGE
jgi:orotidine 5'-phosphate decarboxylase